MWLQNCLDLLWIVCKWVLLIVSIIWSGWLLSFWFWENIIRSGRTALVCKGKATLVNYFKLSYKTAVWVQDSELCFRSDCSCFFVLFFSGSFTHSACFNRHRYTVSIQQKLYELGLWNIVNIFAWFFLQYESFNVRLVICISKYAAITNTRWKITQQWLQFFCGRVWFLKKCFFWC